MNRQKMNKLAHIGFSYEPQSDCYKIYISKNIVLLTRGRDIEIINKELAEKYFKEEAKLKKAEGEQINVKLYTEVIITRDLVKTDYGKEILGNEVIKSLRDMKEKIDKIMETRKYSTTINYEEGTNTEDEELRLKLIPVLRITYDVIDVKPQITEQEIKAFKTEIEKIIKEICD